MSLLATKDSALESNVFSLAGEGNNGLRLLRSIALFGANASGKSNACNAIRAMRRLVVASATDLNEGDEMDWLEPFAFSVSLESQPTRFEISVLLSGSVYRYGFEANAKEILGEWLYVTKSGARSRESLAFNRAGQDKNKWKFGSSYSKGSTHLIERTRSTNCLLLSKAAQEGFSEFKELYQWFKERLRTANMMNYPRNTLRRASDHCHKDSARSGFMAEIFKVADHSIESIGTHEQTIAVPDLARKLLSAEFPEHEFPEEFTETKLDLIRTQTGSNLPKSIDFDEESNGTKRFAAVTNLLLEAFKEGVTLVVDELECSLHPVLTRELIKLMNDPDLGRNNPQFIIATHDSNVFDFTVFRRDQIYLAEKRELMQTELYSLCDLDPVPRVDASAEKQYLSERFGGIPALGNLRLAMASAIEYLEKCDNSKGSQKGDHLQLPTA